MGSCCNKNKALSETLINQKDGTITKCYPKSDDIQFWVELEKLKLVKIYQVYKNKVEFNFSNLFLENFISLGMLMEYLLEGNYFYFFPIYELTLAIIDFIQIVLGLKRRFEKNFFFLVNFDKFYLTKTSSSFSRLIYLDSKLADPYTLSEIIVNEDNQMGSFSILEGMTSMQMLMTTINTSKENVSSGKVEIDMNSFFYSQCNERFQKLRGNFSLDECEKFYAGCILSFVSRFLLKKTNMSTFELEFNNIKSIMRNGLSQKFLLEELHKQNLDLNLQTLKEVLTNFYLNNYEMCLLKNKIEHLLELDYNTQDEVTIGRILSFKRGNVSLSYGECQMESDDVHNVCFISDKMFGTGGPLLSFCINCSSSLVKRKMPSGRENRISIEAFEKEFNRKYSAVDLRYFAKYMCLYINKASFEYPTSDDIQVYMKNEYCVQFENIKWDDDREEVILNEVMNLDFKAKNYIKVSGNKYKSGDNDKKKLFEPKVNNIKYI